MKSIQVSRLLKLLLGLIALLINSCGTTWLPMKGSAAYGVIEPTANPDPSFELIDLNYEPASPVYIGSDITFTVTANRATLQGTGVWVSVGGNVQHISETQRQQLHTRCNDEGIYPDAVERDGIFTGRLTLPSTLGPINKLNVCGRVDWYDVENPQSILGPRISIVNIPEE